MKDQELSHELAEKTVDTLDEIESAVLDVTTGVKAGDRSCHAGACPQAPYGTGTD